MHLAGLPSHKQYMILAVRYRAPYFRLSRVLFGTTPSLSSFLVRTLSFNKDLYSLRTALCYWLTCPQIMPGEQFCQSCAKLFHGEVHVIGKNQNFKISFEHHPNVESLEKALELPCSVCSLAWTTCKIPSKDIPGKVCGDFYKYSAFDTSDERTLRFYLERTSDESNDNTQYESHDIVLVPSESKTINQFCTPS